MEASLNRASYLQYLEDTYRGKIVSFVSPHTHKILYGKVNDINCEVDDDDFRIIIFLGLYRYECTRSYFEKNITIL